MCRAQPMRQGAQNFSRPHLALVQLDHGLGEHIVATLIGGTEPKELDHLPKVADHTRRDSLIREIQFFYAFEKLSFGEVSRNPLIGCRIQNAE